MFNKLIKIFQFSASDIFSLASIWFALLIADLRLRLFPYRFNRHYIFDESQSPLNIGQNSEDNSRNDPARVAALVAIAANNHIIPMTCLRRSLVLRGRLRKMGYNAVIRFGARGKPESPPRSDSRRCLLMHSWVEYNGGCIDTYETKSEFSVFINK